jgi:hypothetical protein
MASGCRKKPDIRFEIFASLCEFVQSALLGVLFGFVVFCLEHDPGTDESVAFGGLDDDVANFAVWDMTRFLKPGEEVTVGIIDRNRRH